MRSELMGAFLEEVEEQLQQLEQDILQLEQGGEAEQTVQSIFRTAHTLKGSSAAMGFEQMKVLTHEMENVLDKIRNHQLAVTSETVNVLFECLDMLVVLKLEIERSGTTHTNTDEIVDKLRALANNTGSASRNIGEALVSAVENETEVAAATSPESKLHRVECRISIAANCEMKAARVFVIHQSLAQRVRILSTSPQMEEVMLQNGVDEVTFFIETGLGLDELEALIRKEHDVEDVVFLHYEETAELYDQKTDFFAKDDFFSQKPVDGSVDKPARKEAESLRKSGQTIRVDVERLDNLMNLVGELVIDQTRIAQVSGMLRDGYHADEAFEELEQISNHIARMISELQESVMKTRMLPIERLFNRFPRMVRDLAHELGKDIELVVVGKETELDRTVIEEIGDPLIHLIRNSVDHGIEPGEERLAAGKPEKGTVRLTAMHQENHVVITVEDDGCGISPDKIRASAVAKGLIPAAAAESMGDREAIQLIFAPGFSTAKTISDISGRGVGMDIVRAHIEKLNGLIDVETKLGESTKFTIKLPLTLAIVRGLLVKLNHRTFALPMSSVVEIVRIPQEEIKSLKGRLVVQIREQILPITWLHDHFQISRVKRAKKNMFVVVVGAAEKRIGLVVDDLIGNQEIVVKSIGSYVGKVKGVSGATILGDGSVALILDVAGVLKLAAEQEASAMAEETPMADK